MRALFAFDLQSPAPERDFFLGYGKHRDPASLGHSRAYHLLYKPVNAERFHAALVDASVLRPPAHSARS
jgi:hypothetical protein